MPAHDLASRFLKEPQPFDAELDDHRKKYKTPHPHPVAGAVHAVLIGAEFASGNTVQATRPKMPCSDGQVVGGFHQ